MPQAESALNAKIGDTLPIFRRTTDLHNWNRFAAVNDEFVSIHMDDNAGRAAGYPTAIGMGNLQWSYLHNMIRNWIGTEGWIRKISCQFRAANTKDMTVASHGVVTAIRDDGNFLEIDLEVWTEDGNGNKLAPGTATVALRTGSTGGRYLS